MVDEVVITNPVNQTESDLTGTILDREWARRAFLLKDIDIDDPDDRENRHWSSADVKFTDTTLGGNIGINARPQFTRYADIRVKGRLSGRNNVSISNSSGDYGLGRYYSEAIDDPSQTIYMRFGVPQFNSLTNFMLQAFDPGQSSLARTGRDTNKWFAAGATAGAVAQVIAFPPIAIPILASKLINYFYQRPTSKFYTLKPTMGLYWSAVETLTNTIAINKGIFPRVFKTEEKSIINTILGAPQQDGATPQRLGEPFQLDQEYLSALSEMMPDVFNGYNHFSVMAVANKTTRAANKLHTDEYNNLNQSTPTNYYGYLKRSAYDKGSHATMVSKPDGGHTIKAWLDEITKLTQFTGDSEDKNLLEFDPRVDNTSETGTRKADDSFFKDFAAHEDAEFREGNQWAVFKVDHTGAVDESFTNSVVESHLSQKLNQTSSDVREAKFSFSYGNLVGGNAVGDLFQSVVGGLTDFVAGAASQLTFGITDILGGLAGNGFIDIPSHWQSSAVRLPTTTYTMQLVSPYGNPISLMQNIYIPLCMLLAAAMPLSTGKQSYTSPFLCQIFDRGRSQIRLGIVESLTIRRGITNLPFNVKGTPLGIEASLVVKDLSSIMHMSMSTGILSGVNMTLDEDNILSDYLAVLAGQGMDSQIHEMAKAKLVAAKRVAQLQQFFSPANMATMFHEEMTSGLFSYLTLKSFTALEGVSRGSPIITN